MTSSRITGHQAPPFCFRDGGASAMGRRISQTAPLNLFSGFLPIFAQITFYSLLSEKSSSPPLFSSNSKAQAANAKPHSKVSFFETNSTDEQQPQEFAQTNYLAPFPISPEFAQANFIGTMGDSSDTRVCLSKLFMTPNTQEFAQTNTTDTTAGRHNHARVCSSKLHKLPKAVRAHSQASEFAQANRRCNGIGGGGVCSSKLQRQPRVTRAIKHRVRGPQGKPNPAAAGFGVSGLAEMRVSP